MTTCSTHVLDAAHGRPAEGIAVRLLSADGALVEEAATDSDGRVRFAADLDGGGFKVVFATGDWFTAADRPTLFPTVGLAFEVDPAEGHYHLALLLSPFSYTVYRGS